MNRTIGKSLGFGFAGNYSRQPDSVIDSHVVKGEAPVYFGDPVIMDSDGFARAVTGDFDPKRFVGIATSAIQSAITVDNMDGVYRANESASIMTRGVVSVICQEGEPVKGGAVYVRVDNATGDQKLGGFEAVDADPDTVELLHCVWASVKDANNVAEIRLKTINLV